VYETFQGNLEENKDLFFSSVTPGSQLDLNHVSPLIIVRNTIGSPKMRVEIFTLARGARACIESTQFIIMTIIIIIR
jgi:hypothetical protein